MELLNNLIAIYMDNIGYVSIIALMAIESSFIPFPSEIIIPPAAWKAAQGELNIVLVVLSGLLGSIIGAVFNYFFAMSLGRKLIYAFARTRLAHFMLIDEAAIMKAELYFNKHGASTTFFGRLIPAIRQLISLPAGLSRMNFGVFILFTSLGAGIWCTVLAALGYFLYSQKEVLEKIEDGLKIGGIILGVLFIAYLVYHGLRKEKKPAETESASE